MYCYHCMKSINDGDAHCPHCGKSTAVKANPHHLRPGTVLNKKYLIGCAIGEGGFGITYIGRDLTLQRRIAIKEYFPKGYANRDSGVTNRVTLTLSNEDAYFKNGKQRFLREAQSIAKFSDEEGIVDVRDFFEENDTAYIVMEYLDGETMAQYLKTHGRIDARSIFMLLLPAMRALEKMHRQGVIHRDISPDNIMVLKDGQVKLMDFGSARYFIESEKHTMSVTLKPGYAPYEQYSSKGDQGPWTDVYGICATLYKCITGVTPDDPTIRCQHDTLQMPSRMGIAVPPQLEQVLQYGLAVFPEHRCRSMEELIRLIRDALKHSEGDLTVLAEDPTPDIPVIPAAPIMPPQNIAPPRRSYGDTGYYSGRPSTVRPTTQPPAPQRRSYTGVIAFCIILSLLIIGGLVLFLVFRDSILPDNHPTASSVAAGTDAPATQAVTEADKTVILPDVSGKKLSDAQSELEEMGLIIETTQEETNEVAEGYVIRQSIDPDRTVNVGDTIMLYVAKAPSPTEPPATTVAATEAPAAQSDAQAILYNTLCREFVTLRSSASMKASEVTKIPRGASVELLEEAGSSDFIRVRYSGKTGYALAAFFTSESASNGRYVMYCVARQYANLRSQPGSDNSNNIDTIPTDSPVQCTGGYEYVGNQRYLKIIYHNRSGYVLADVFSSTMDGSTYKGD